MNNKIIFFQFPSFLLVSIGLKLDVFGFIMPISFMLIGYLYRDGDIGSRSRINSGAVHGKMLLTLFMLAHRYKLHKKAHKESRKAKII